MSAQKLLAIDNLARARQTSFDPDSGDVYLHILRNLSDDAVTRACEELASEPVADFTSPMPTAGTLKQRAEKCARRIAAETDRQKYLPPTPNEETFKCSQCHDVEWIMLSCDGWRCERPPKDGQPHYKHWFTARCPCWFRKHGTAIDLAANERREKGKELTKDQRDNQDFQGGVYKWQHAQTER